MDAVTSLAINNALLFLSETWMLKSEDLPDVQGYKKLARLASRRAERGRGSGGLLLYIPDDFWSKCSFPEPPFLKNLVIWVSLKSTLGSKYIIGFCYRPPRESNYYVPDFFGQLGQSLTWLGENGYGSCVPIIQGDLNCRIGQEVEEDPELWSSQTPAEMVELRLQATSRSSADEVCNACGREMLSWCNLYGLGIANGRGYGDEGGVTFVGHQGASVVDYAILPMDLMEERVRKLEILNRTESDHLPVALAVSWEEEEMTGEGGEEEEMEGEVIAEFKWKESLKEQFLGKLELLLMFFVGLLNLLMFDSSMTVDGAIKCFTQTLQTVANMMRWRRGGGNQRKAKPAWKQGREAKAALRRFRKDRTKEKLQEYLEKKKAFQDEVERLRKEEEQKKEAELVQLYRVKDAKEMWRRIKGFVKPRGVKDGRIKAESWLEYFKSVFNVHQVERPEWNMELEEMSCQSCPELDGPITDVEVTWSLRKAKCGKACGVDGIPVEFFKKAEVIFRNFLRRLFSHILAKGVYPLQWSKSIIHPIFKGKGSSKDPTGYRGVALLPHMAKLLTRILNERLRTWLFGRNLISDRQAGYRAGYSTMDNCFILDTIIRRRLRRRGGRLYAGFVDFRRAFDGISRPALFLKLATAGVSAKFIKLLKSMYDNARFSVRLEGEKISSEAQSTSGVLQGCQLSPLLFSFYINDLVEWLNIEGSHSPGLRNEEVHLLLFADDLVLLSNTPVGLQRLLDRLVEYCRKWSMQVNTEKSKVMVFSNGGTTRRGEAWFFEGKKLEVVRKFRYLGLLFGSSGQWTQQIEGAKKLTKMAAGRVKRFLYKFSNIPLSLAMHLVDSLVVSSLMYGAEIWGIDCGDKINSVMRQLYKSILRVPQSAPGSATELILGRSSAGRLARERAIRYWLNLLDTHDDRLVKKCYLQQRANVERNQECWALSVKKELYRMGFGYVWENGGPVNPDQFISEYVQRSKDTDKQERWEEASKLPSLGAFNSLDRELDFFTKISTLENQKRRLASMILMNCPGSFVDRVADLKLCCKCALPLQGSVFVHLVVGCERSKGRAAHFGILEVVDRIRCAPNPLFSLCSNIMSSSGLLEMMLEVPNSDVCRELQKP